MHSTGNQVVEELKELNLQLREMRNMLVPLLQKENIRNDYLKVSEFALEVKKSQQTVRRWIKKGVISRVIRVNGSYLIEKKEIDLLHFKTKLQNKEISL